MNKIFLLILLILATNNSYCQKNKSWGIKIGANSLIPIKKNQDIFSDQESRITKIGMKIDGDYTYRINSKISIVNVLSYYITRFKNESEISMVVYNPDGIIINNYRIQNISLSFLASYNINKKFNVNGGISFDQPFQIKTKTSAASYPQSTYFTNIKDDYRYFGNYISINFNIKYYIDNLFFPKQKIYTYSDFKIPILYHQYGGEKYNSNFNYLEYQKGINRFLSIGLGLDI